MSDYISRESALKAIFDSANSTLEFEDPADSSTMIYLIATSNAREAVKGIPAADVVPRDWHDRCMEIEIQNRIAADVRPVVLCRDCRYSEKGDKDFLYCNTWDAWNVPTDGFCSFGERDKTESNAPRLKRPDPCSDCRWSPPSSFGGKPCLHCVTDDPLMNCYQKREVSE